jgi:hypothetical protein
MVEEKRQRGGRNTAAERTRLARQMTYATEQGDLEEAARYIINLDIELFLVAQFFSSSSSRSIGAAPLSHIASIAGARAQLQRMSNSSAIRWQSAHKRAALSAVQAAGGAGGAGGARQDRCRARHPQQHGRRQRPQ